MFGYYITDPEEIVSFPRAPRWSSEDIAIDENVIEHQTDGGVRWIYPLYQRRAPSYTFRVPVAQLANFQALHEAVNGQETPFYLVLDVDASPLVALYVRKESGFHPAKVGPGMYQGAIVPWYDYTLKLTEEIAPGAVNT